MSASESMRNIMNRIDELFNANSDKKFNKAKIGDDTSYTFMSGQDMFIVDFFYSGDIRDKNEEYYPSYELLFHNAQDEGSHDKYDSRNDNKGNQYDILEAVVSISKDFLSNNSDACLEFEGKSGVSMGKSLQGEVYSLILRKLKPVIISLGFKIDKGTAFRSSYKKFCIYPKSFEL